MLVHRGSGSGKGARSTSDLTFIPFHQRWASGFAQLLEKLDSIGAPRHGLNGRKAVCQWFAARSSVVEKPERIWTNLLEVREIPRTLLKFALPTGRIDVQLLFRRAFKPLADIKGWDDPHILMEWRTLTVGTSR